MTLFQEFVCCLPTDLALCFGSLEREQKVRSNCNFLLFFPNFFPRKGATVRIYFEQYTKTDFHVPAQQALAPLIAIAEELSETKKRAQRDAPDVVS